MFGSGPNPISTIATRSPIRCAARRPSPCRSCCKSCLADCRMDAELTGIALHGTLCTRQRGCMKSSILLLHLVLSSPMGADAPAPAEAGREFLNARRAGWELAVQVAETLAAGENRGFPGIE